MHSIKNKIIAILLVTIIALGNLAFLGENISATYANYASMENQTLATNNENVEFDAYFKSEGKKTHSYAQNIAEKAELYIDFEVKGTGYLKEATVKVDANYKVEENYKQEEIQKIENNKIELNQISGNSNKTTIALPVYFDVNEKVNIASFNRENKITLEAKYIDDVGKEHKIEKTILNQLTWTASPELKVEQTIEKYVPYVVEETKGIIVEQKVKAQIDNEILPIAETNMEITVPKIQDVMPKIAIRKQGEIKFNSKNWNYNEQNGKIIIKETNMPSDSGEIAWNTMEEYIITYRYENVEMPEELTFQSKIASNVKVYGGETLNLTKTCDEDIKCTETIGQIIDAKAEIVEEKISKGYLYTNLENTEKLETPYQVNYGIDISYSKIADEIILKTNQEQWYIQEEKMPANTYIKQISINKENFKEILGEEGNITILLNNKEIAKLTLQENNEETIYANIADQNLNTITLKTSKPQKEGTLNIILNKAIKAENTISKEQIQNIESLETSVTMQIMKEEKEILNATKTASVTMVEPTSKINVEISKTQFSTVVDKEEVEIRTTLKTNSEYDSLYKNPSIDIILPKDIESVEILGTELLYEDELKIETVELINETNKIIRIKLNGNQTKYSMNEVAQGATIVVRANVKINNLTPTKSEKIQVLYTNQKCVQYEAQAQDGRGISEINIKYIAPTGLVPINTISNFAENKMIRSIAGSSEQGILEVSSNSRIATSEIELINNYNNKINNIRILGRTLTTNTTDTQTNQNLENTFDTIMVSPITSETISQEQYSVYYSENGEATEDLNNSTNAWTLDNANLANVKSYLIVLSNYEMNTADSIKFSYQMQIPEGLNYNEKVNSVYTAYFDNIQEEQTIKDSVKAANASLTTGEAPKLEVELTSYSQENNQVREGQYIKFKANIKNTGSMDAENVKLNIVAPSGEIYYYIENGNIYFTDNLNGKEGSLVATYETKHTQFMEDDFRSEYEEQEDANRTIDVGSIKAKESKEIEYELKIEDVTIITKNLPAQNGALVKPEIVISNTAEVISDKMPKAIASNEYKLVLTEAAMQVIASSDKSSDYILTKGSKITYTAQIENITAAPSLKGLEVTVKIPEGLKIVQATTKNRIVSSENKKVDINTNSNTVTFKMDELSKEDSIDFIVEAQVEDAKNRTISVAITAKAEGTDEHTSNIISNKVQTLNFSIEQQKLDQEYFKEAEEITYTYVVKNNSEVYVDSFKFENKIPDGTTFKEAKIKFKDGEQSIKEIEENKLVVETEFLEGEEIKIGLTVLTNKLEEGKTEKQIENYATIEGDLFEKIESNHILNIIEYNEKTHNSIENDDSEETENEDNNSNSNVEGRYKISGTAWIDSNKNGERDEKEQTIEGLKVRLLNQENKTIVKDVDSKEEKITTTGSKGKYTFENLVKGKYVVVFEYNNAEYELTQYQKENISKLVNSDAIAMEMNIDGKEKIVAVSDTLNIEDSNIRNIDIGMYIAAKSDLSLEKYINKITVTYGDTTKAYEYNNEKIAKVEIPGKNLSQATVVVEYKIVVKNEGDIGNYVKKIVDYVPKDMKFDAELNKDWYQSTNGDLYNSSLANIKLEPGEEKEVTLTLSKKITENTAQIINNNAEIYEVYNEEGISDIDSQPANKVSKEDDMSSADVVISIKTGEIVAQVGIISMLICIAIIAVAYAFNKKVRKFVWRG